MTSTFNIDELSQKPNSERLDYVQKHVAELTNAEGEYTLQQHEHDKLVKLLLAASPADLRREYPIIGEKREQDKFEAEVIPIGDTTTDEDVQL